MLIPSSTDVMDNYTTSLSRRVNANSQLDADFVVAITPEILRKLVEGLR